MEAVAGLARENLSEKKAVEVSDYLDCFISRDIWEMEQEVHFLRQQQAEVLRTGVLQGKEVGRTGKMIF